MDIGSLKWRTVVTAVIYESH